MRNKIYWIFIILISSSIKFSICENILALIGVGSPSHHLWSDVLINSLAVRGHNITLLTADISKSNDKSLKNLHYLHLEQIYNTRAKLIDFNKFMNGNQFQQIPIFYKLGHSACQGAINSKGFKTLLNYSDKTHFDLVLYEYTSGPCLLGFLHKFNYPPLVGLTAFHSPPNTEDLVGGHYYSSYIPFFSTSYDTDMTFIQRIHNTLIYLADKLYRTYIYTPTIDKMVRPVFPKNMPYLGDLDKRAALVLVNSHPVVNNPEPFPPNVIEVGGIQLTGNKPLPLELERFINKSKKGAILFSLGTNMKNQSLGIARCKIILDAMTQLPDYNFLWKFDTNFTDSSLNVPKNVLIKSFLPQKDILAHKKLKLFITHAGGLSVQEAIWYRVPIIGIPLFLDQQRNLQKVVKMGAAEVIDYKKLNTDILCDTIKLVSENSKYRENMKIHSEIFRDRPLSALDTAIWWIEYVLRRHSHLDHLKSPTLKLGFWRSNCLDVYSFIIFTFVTVLWILFKILKNLLIRKGNDHHVKIKKNN